MTNTISWIDPTGVEIDLPVQARKGLAQRMMTRTVVTQTAVPFQPGGRAMQYRHDVRPVVVPLVLTGDPDTLRDQYRSWAHLLDPTRGDGTLRCTRSDGSTRDLTCRCTAGWDFAEDYEHYVTTALTFSAIDDPYWRDSAGVTVGFTAGNSTPVTTWFPFSFPFTFGASEVFATKGIDNGGDVDAWPVWTINGPGTDLEIVNNDTGQRIALDSTLGFTLIAHASVVIDTRPRAKTVTRSDGTSMFSAMSLDSELFAIAPGGASVSVSMAGATTLSLVSVTYRVGYLAA